MTDLLESILRQKNIDDKIINDVIDSGYFTLDGQYIHDAMYGDKMFSSSFEIGKFISYINGEDSFADLREYSHFKTYTVKNIEDIKNILNTPRILHYINEGTLSYRGQSKEYHFKRKIPNPFRRILTPGNLYNHELAILPGLYRSKDRMYSFSVKIKENLSIFHSLHLISAEFENMNLFDISYSPDVVRVEQHYGHPTEGLDISFDIETAIFFATYKYINERGKATYRKIDPGNHKGVIYCFRFGSPSVRETEYLIKDFDLCKKYVPERILRQRCGLPLFNPYERNIAVCDIDCIIYLDKNFDYSGMKTPQYMFPNEEQDSFYGQIMKIKRLRPKLFHHIPEYCFDTLGN